MLQINVKDCEEGFEATVNAAGTPEMIAQQLHSVISNITKAHPQIIDLMAECAKMDTEEN